MNLLSVFILHLKTKLVFVGCFVFVLLLFLHSGFCLLSSCSNILTKLKGIEMFSMSRCATAILPFVWLEKSHFDIVPQILPVRWISLHPVLTILSQSLGPALLDLRFAAASKPSVTLRPNLLLPYRNLPT